MPCPAGDAENVVHKIARQENVVNLAKLEIRDIKMQERVSTVLLIML